jgi:hypothetical protein
MPLHHVTCVSKQPSADDRHVHVVALGLGTFHGWHARVSLSDAISQLRNRSGDRYFIVLPGTSSETVVIEGECRVCGMRPYLRTTADETDNSNLDDMPECMGRPLQTP